MGLNWITKNQRERESTNSTSSGFTSPNTIDGLYAADIIISPSELSLLVRKSGSVLAQILTNKIVVWDLTFNIITIITEDPTYLVLKFQSPVEAINALTTIESAVNS